MRALYLRFCQRYEASLRWYLPRLLLICGILVYAGTWGVYHLNVLNQRSELPEIDDAYTYLWHATRMKNCLTTCTALADMEQIVFMPAGDTALHNARGRVISRMIALYTPLQAAGMSLAQTVGGLSPEQSFYGLIAFGLLLQIIGLSYLAGVLLGRGAAGVALILLAFTVHRGQGFHTIVPATMTLAIALIVWSRILQRGRDAWQALLAGSLILTISHTTGRLYALIAIFLFLVSGNWRLTRREIGVVVAGVFIVGSYWIFARTVQAPAIDFPEGTFIDPANTPYLTLVAEQVRYLLEQVNTSLRSFSSQSHAISLTCLALALVALPGERQKRLLRLALPVAGLIGLMTLYVLPGYPNEGLYRTYPIAVVIGQMLLAWLLYVSITRLGKLLHRAIGRGHLPGMTPTGYGSLHLWLMLGWLFMTINASITFGSALARGISDIRAVSQVAIERQNLELNHSAVAAVLAEIEPGDGILYPYEIPFQYAMTHGTYPYHTVYLPILDEAQRVAAPATDYVITANPLVTRRDVLPLNEISGLKITLPDAVIAPDLHLYIINPAAGFELKVTVDTKTDSQGVAAGYEGWLTFDHNGAHQLAIEAVNAAPGAAIQRIRFSDSAIDDSIWYPWEQRAVINYRLNDIDVTANFDPALLAAGIDRNVTVLDDSGYLVSARLD